MASAAHTELGDDDLLAGPHSATQLAPAAAVSEAEFIGLMEQVGACCRAPLCMSTAQCFEAVGPREKPALRQCV